MDIIDIIFPFIFVSTAVTTVILIQDSRDADGEQVYNTSTLVLVMEMVKIVISLVLVAYEGRMKELQAVSLSEFLKFAIPAFLYCINNNIFVHIFTVLEPTVFLLICNIRVIWVAIIYSFCMKRTITRNQWIACILLVLGAALSQVDEYHQIVPSGASPEFNVGTLLDSVASLFTMGMMLGLVYTLVSTMAGISVELLLKNQQSVNVAGVLLYSLGAIFNVMLAIAQVHLLPSAKYDNLDRTNADSVIEVGNDSDETIMGHLIHQQENQTPVEDVQWVDWEAMSHTYLRGWELPATWCIMGLMAINGLMIARVMRRYDNIVKIAYTSISNVILYLYAVYIEESRTLSFTLVISFVVINYASYMYQNNKQLYKTPMLEMRQLEIIASAALEDDVEMGCCLFAHPRDHQMSRTSAEAAIHKDVTRMASVSIG